MKIRKLILRNFMSHDDTELSLPDKGLVVVAGPTGAGKSSLVEAAAYAAYGDALRPTPPWRKDTAGYVEVQTDQIRASRTITAKGKESTLWEASGDTQKNYATPSKAAEALQRHVGVPFDVWRRCCVFSAGSTDAFSRSPDSKRKEFIEEMLGADRFDLALKMAKAEQQVAQSRLMVLQNEVALNETRRDTLIQAVSSSVGLGVQYDSAKHENVVARHKALAKERKEVDAAYREALQAESDLNSRKKEIQRRLLDLQKRVCAACGQSIPLDNRDSLLSKAEQDLRALAQDTELRAATVREFTEVFQDLAGELDTLNAEMQMFAAAKAKTAALSEEHARKAKMREDLALCEARLKDLAGEWDAVQYAADLTEYVVQALNIRGVRARMLNGVLSSLQRNTNHWLVRLAPERGIQVKIDPFRNLKSGGVEERINITVIGAGGGYNYWAASTGQQRVIDLAILLSLSVMAAAAHGADHPTLWFDEPFDNLDSILQENLTKCLLEMAKHQCVVVITHNETMKRAPTSRKLWVEGGKVTAA